MADYRLMERKKGTFARAFQITYGRSLVKGEEFWWSFFSGLFGWQYKYKSKQHPLTLNNPKPSRMTRDNKVTAGWDKNTYNWVESILAFLVRVPKNLLKLVTQLIPVMIYLKQKPGSTSRDVFWAIARILETFNGPIAAVSQTAESALESHRSNPNRSWVYEIPGVARTLLHVVLATCIATAYLILAATAIFSLLYSVGLGSAVVIPVVNAASFLASLPFFAPLGAPFVSLLTKGGAMIGLSSGISGLLPATSIASSLLTLIVPAAAVRWLLKRQSLDISPFIKRVVNFFRRNKGVSTVKAESSPRLSPQLTNSRHSLDADLSLLSAVEGDEAKYSSGRPLQLANAHLKQYKIVPLFKTDKPITIDSSKVTAVKISVNRKGGNVNPYNLGNTDPNIIITADGKTFTYKIHPLKKHIPDREEKRPVNTSTGLMETAFAQTPSSPSASGVGLPLAVSEQPEETSWEVSATNGQPLVISDNPIQAQFLQRPSDTTNSSDETVVLSLGSGRNSLQLQLKNASLAQINTALNKPPQPSKAASTTAESAASSAPPGSSIIIGQGEVKPFNTTHTDRDVHLLAGESESERGKFQLKGPIGKAFPYLQFSPQPLPGNSITPDSSAQATSLPHNKKSS